MDRERSKQRGAADILHDSGQRGGVDRIPGHIATILALQRSAGNAAVSRLLSGSAPNKDPVVVQRAFNPAAVTTKTRLHTIADVPRANRPDRLKDRGTTGDNIASGTEVLVDYADQKVLRTENWVKATTVAPRDWDPVVHKNVTTRLRGSKLGHTATSYPRLGAAYYAGAPISGGTVDFHEDLGEYLKVAPHPAGDGSWLVRRTRDGRGAIARGGAVELKDTWTFQERLTLGEVLKKGVAPDGKVLYVERTNPMAYGKHDPVLLTDTMPVVLTAEEVRATKEFAQKGALAQNLAKDPKLASTAIALATTNIVYVHATGNRTVHVHYNTTDPAHVDQLSAVRAGLVKLQVAGVPVPDGMAFYLSSAAITQEAFHYDAGHIVLTQGMLSDPAIVETEIKSGVKGGVGAGIRGVAHQVGDESAKAGKEKQGVIGCGVVTHEVGHVMHRKANPAIFFKTQDISFQISDLHVDLNAVKIAAAKISHYVSREDNHSKLVLEFVAEVFTGLIHGKKYPLDVIDFYIAFGGYQTWADKNDVVAVD